MGSNVGGCEVIGDIHGHASELRTLLAGMGNTQHG
jgi:hypothetical protein